MLGLPSASEALRDEAYAGPPTGWPRSVLLRMIAEWSSFTIVAPKVLVSPSAKSCARPVVMASKPGTLAPLCTTG